MWTSSADSHLSLLDSVVRIAEGLCEALGHRRKDSALYFHYKIYHRPDHPLREYLLHFVAARNTGAPAALCELTLVISRCRTDQFNQSFLPVAVHKWNWLPSDVFGGGTLSSFKSAKKLCLQMD